MIDRSIGSLTLKYKEKNHIKKLEEITTGLKQMPVFTFMDLISFEATTAALHLYSKAEKMNYLNSYEYCHKLKMTTYYSIYCYYGMNTFFCRC